MVRRNDREDLLAAWRALGGSSEAEGWRTIPVATGGACRLFAGRHFPGNEEAIIVAFATGSVPPPDQLPQGRGFQVTRANIEGMTPCIALCRESAGSLDLFAMMAVDIADALAGIVGDDERVLQLFLARIRAWQEFMRRSSDSVLSPDSEVGLFGELAFLQGLVSASLPAAVAIEAWQGPMDGLQDFLLGTGAIEVKSTVLPQGFPAVVGSLDQLDDSLIRPLFLAGVRLIQSSAGRTLPDIVRDVRAILDADSSSLTTFNTRLLHAGYFEQVSERYTRRFSVVSTRLLEIADGVPRLTHANVPMAIRRVTYELDLDLVAAEVIPVATALHALGAR